MSRLLWTLESVEDLESIRDYIARDSPRYARAVIERLIERAELAAEFPESGRVVPEFGRTEIREVILGAYRIVYRIRADSVRIITIFRSSRLFPLERLDSEG